MLFWSNDSLTFNIIFCQRYYSLRSWRYCLGARLKFWRRSHNPKKGVGTRRLKYLFLAAYATLDGFATKSHSTITQYRQLRGLTSR